MESIVGDFFGTDGIRGIANQYPLDCETVVIIGRAIADYFAERATHSGAQRFVVGQDTRLSGDMIVGALAAGICSMGKDVHLAGVLPTPGVAYLTRTQDFDAGVVVSASHNPFADNGIKLFARDGYKLSDAAERSIEQRIGLAGLLAQKSAAIHHVGRIHRIGDALDRYADFLSGCLADGVSLVGMKLVIDCSNGAASEIAPRLFTRLGATVEPIFDSPDGMNINAACGSQHPKALAAAVVAEKADLGLAFDGDADRLIAVDEAGTVLTGDQVMAVLAETLQATGQLGKPLVVTTVMSNLGLGLALKRMKIEHVQAQVGDRHVMQMMIESGAVLGGEDSGHTIVLNHHTTGDGILAALKLIEAVRTSGKPLSELATVMSVFPQRLINVDVASKPPLESVESVMHEIREVERRLGDKGRVLVRYSGTQPQCRVMVEGPTAQETDAWCRQIAAVVERELG